MEISKFLQMNSNTQLSSSISDGLSQIMVKRSFQNDSFSLMCFFFCPFLGFVFGSGLEETALFFFFFFFFILVVVVVCAT